MEKKWLLIGGATIAIVGGVAYLLSRRQATIYVGAGEGGTTNPVPGEYKAVVGSSFSVEAIPDEGYDFNGWVVDGASAGTDNPISLHVARDVHTIVALFIVEGEDGGQIPVGISCLNSPITHTQWYMCYWVPTDPVGQHGYIKPVLSRDPWIDFGRSQGILKFMVEDAAGKGVRNIPVLLWTNDVPDVSGEGKILLGGDVHTSVNPLVLKSLSDGVVYVPVGYKWTEPPNELSKQYVKYRPLWPPVEALFFECRSEFEPVIAFWGEGFSSVTHIPNFVYGQVKGTALPTATGVAQCIAGVYAGSLPPPPPAEPHLLSVAYSFGGVVKPGTGYYTGTVTLKATPDPEYAVGRWYLDGVEKQIGGAYFYVTMDKDHEVMCEFKPIA